MVLLVGALVAASCTTDDDDASGADGTRDVPSNVAELMDADEYATARWALRVAPIEGDGATSEVAPDKISAMASNAKLYSVGTWLDVYGPDDTIETPVYGLGEVGGGTLGGDLVLRAMGDLVMGGREAGSGELGYSVPPQPDANGLPGAMPSPGDPLAGLNDLAEQVAAAGVTDVGGNVVIDDRLFEPWTTPRPLEVSPIVINDNLMAIVTTPGTEGEPATIEAIPETAAFTVVNDTETVAAGADSTIELEPVPDAEGEPTNTLTVSGQIATDSDPTLNIYDVPDPASFARTLFIEALQRAGVTVTADPLAVNEAGALPDADSYETDNDPLATLTSPPLSEIATLIWKISHNYGADLSVCLLAVSEGSTDCEDGFAPIRSRIDDRGINQDEVWMLDGSGSNMASTTPHAMTTWIQWLHTLDWGDQLTEMLPILGTDGSLTLAQQDSPAKGKVQAKTGTWASHDPGSGLFLMLDQSLAGLMESDDGETYAFAVYLNGTTVQTPDELLDILDQVAGVAAALQQSL